MQHPDDDDRSIYLCEPGWEERLVGELSRVFPGSIHEWVDPGWVESKLAVDSDLCPAIAFARQCLPTVKPLSEPSVTKWAKTATDGIIEKLHGVETPWRLHVVSIPVPGGSAGPRRCQLIDAAIRESLKKRQRRLLRTLNVEPLPFAADEWFVQVGLRSAEHGYLSIAGPEVRHRLRRCLSPHPGGIFDVPSDRNAPSRAFQKLIEAENQFGVCIQVGETCVDLGSSPGGWAYVAIERGARVIAVDRSPLRDDLMNHPRLTFVKGDAFKYAPEQPVDWLLSDVIAYPDRIIELLDHWLSRRLCRRFVVTVKFKGDDDDQRLEDMKRTLERHADDFVVRRLTCNKNEATAFGTVKASGVSYDAGESIEQ